LLMKMRSKMQNEKGFTLVELMVVVVILGILVAIAVPVYNSVTLKAAYSAHDANLRTLDGAIMLYQTNHDGADPSQISDLDLQTEPVIPEALRGDDKAFAANAVYSISGDPVRAWPVGTWDNAYRKGDTTN
jgi:prepilin-type N-terminal cleavage/methylation domain-containing protein